MAQQRKLIGTLSSTLPGGRQSFLLILTASQSPLFADFLCARLLLLTSTWKITDG